jgi:hypothetical protein
MVGKLVSHYRVFEKLGESGEVPAAKEMKQ